MSAVNHGCRRHRIKKVEKMKKILLFILLSPFLVCHADDETGPTVPDGYIGGHPYVDLGLPSGTLWAVYNVGSDDEYYCGDYFAWGETEPKELYSWETYKFFKEFIIDPETGFIVDVDFEEIGDCISDTEYDAAKANWGNGWVMPDSSQIEEMRLHTFSRRVKENGVGGMRVFSRKYDAEKSIFLGDFGTGYDGYMPEDDGYYWTGNSSSYNTELTNHPQFAGNILCQHYTEEVAWNGTCRKYVGLNIRAVVKKGAAIDNVTFNPADHSISVLGSFLIINGEIMDGYLELYDTSGRKVSSLEIIDSKCPIPDTAPGVYIASVIKDGARLFSDKIILK